MTTPRPITLRSGELVLEVVPSGAAVRRLAVLEPGGPLDLVLGHRDPATYIGGGGYLGATIGRFGNRIDAGRFTLDGVEHRLATNQYGNTLHGGPRGFDAQEWTVLSAEDTRTSLRLVSPDGDQGFPGRLEVTITYTLEADGVRIDYAARADAPTVLNLTNHSYFQLDGAGSGPIDDHVLQVHAAAYLPIRADLIPTGEVAPVAGTPFDLRRPTRLGEVLAGDHEQLRRAGGLDHNLVLDGTGLREVARLTGAGGRRLVVHTDRPGVQVYTGAHFDGSIVGLDGSRYDHQAGLALETQGFPDAPNHPGFPSAVLRPGEEFTSTTLWRLGRD